MRLRLPWLGGRWAPRDSVPVLYTSLQRDGAIAEIAFHLAQLTPRPTKPIMVHKLRVSARQVLRFLRADLSTLGIDLEGYGSLNYRQTQEIGAAVAFLECDGLIAPSARWTCDNLMLFMNNHALENKLEIKTSEALDWIEWVRDKEFIENIVEPKT